MGIFDFITKKGTAQTKGVGLALYGLARETFSEGYQGNLKSLFSEDRLSDEQIFSISFEQFLVRLSICYYWLDRAFELQKITREKRDKINVDLTLELQDLACRMELEFQVDRYDFFFFTTDKIRTYRVSYQDDAAEKQEEKKGGPQFMKTAGLILQASLQPRIVNEVNDRSKSKVSSRKAKKGKRRVKEIRNKKKANQLTGKLSKYISPDIRSVTDEVRKILKVGRLLS
jgi:hypothetical protein